MSKDEERTPFQKITLSSLLGSFRVVDCSTFCKANHSPKDRKGCKVAAEEALDEDGRLRGRYEALTDRDGLQTGEYALRADAPVYEKADDCLKEGLRKISNELADICRQVGGGTLILTEANYPAWDVCLARITDITTQVTKDLSEMRIDDEDPESPKINDFLRASNKKAIGLTYRPILHPIVRIADPDARAQAAALVEATRQQVQDIINAVKSADPDQISDVLNAAKNIDAAIADPETRGSIRKVLETAKKAKELAQEERHKAKMIQKALDRQSKRTGTDEKTLNAIERDASSIAQFQGQQILAKKQMVAAQREMGNLAENITQRFAAVIMDDADLNVGAEDCNRLFGTRNLDLGGVRVESLETRIARAVPVEKKSRAVAIMMDDPEPEEKVEPVVPASVDPIMDPPVPEEPVAEPPAPVEPEEPVAEPPASVDPIMDPPVPEEPPIVETPVPEEPVAEPPAPVEPPQLTKAEKLAKIRAAKQKK